MRKCLMFARAFLSYHSARIPACPENLPNPIIPTLLSRASFERHSRPSCKFNYSRTSAMPGGGGYTGFLVRPIHFVSKAFISPTYEISVRNSFVSPTYAKTGGCTPQKMSARRHHLLPLPPQLPL